MQNAFIIDGQRSPIGAFRGGLAEVRADDLAALAIKKLVARHPSLPLEEIEDVLLGCANQAGEDNRNVARMAVLLAGLPVSVGGETVNRLCASGLSALAQAARAIRSGEGEIFIAGGVENMTRGPLVLSKTAQAFGQDQQLFDSSFGWRFINPAMQAAFGVDPMGATAENLAEKLAISRADQDLFALRSQQKAARAEADGIFQNELFSVEIPTKKPAPNSIRGGEPRLFERDEFLKPATTLEALGKLRPAFKKDGGTVTAGNSSGLNDGAAALLIASESASKRLNLEPKARIVAAAVAGCEPRLMGIGPVEASQKALARAGLSLEKMDWIELNEAFAAQVLACSRSMNLADDDPRLNPCGGAIALGHPLGMSGARIALAAANGLERTGGRFALVTMCVGVGQGFAVVLERV